MDIKEIDQLINVMSPKEGQLKDDKIKDNFLTHLVGFVSGKVGERENIKLNTKKEYLETVEYFEELQKTVKTRFNAYLIKNGLERKSINSYSMIRELEGYKQASKELVFSISMHKNCPECGFDVGTEIMKMFKEL